MHSPAQCDAPVTRRLGQRLAEVLARPARSDYRLHPRRRSVQGGAAGQEQELARRAVAAPHEEQETALEDGVVGAVGMRHDAAEAGEAADDALPGVEVRDPGEERALELVASIAPVSS